MLFEIERVSDPTKQPCKESFWGNYDVDIEVFHNSNGDPLERPVIYTIHGEGWMIEISSVEELQKMVDKYNDIIIEKPKDGHQYYRLIIYDGYIE